jgi:hypothetical protein
MEILYIIIGIVVVLACMIIYNGFLSEESKDFIRHFLPAIGIFVSLATLVWFVFGLVKEIFS